LPGPVVAFLRRWRIWQLAALALLFVGGCGFYTAAVLLFITNPRAGSSKQQTLQEIDFETPDGHFNFTYKTKDWQPADIESQGKLKPLLVIKRGQPSSTMVISAEDLHDQQPSEMVLRDLTLSRLRAGFADLKTRDWRKSKLAGKEAWRLDIQGNDISGKFVGGESFTVYHLGEAYFLVFWRPADEKASLNAEWEEMREGVVLTD
jgi:hypothetical protein